MNAKRMPRELTPKKLGNLLAEESRARLERLISSLSAEEVEVKSKVLLGTPFVQVFSPYASM